MVNLVDSLLSSQQTSAVMRPGIVTDWDPTRVRILVGGSEFDAAYLDSYNPPIVGDLVACVRQDSTWMVFGRFAGTGVNLVINPSFEESAVGTTPSSWTFQTFDGMPPTTTVSVVADEDAPQAGQVARVAHINTSSSHLLLSNYIPVAAGQTYFFSAYVGAFGWVSTNPLATPNNIGEIHACWQTTDTEVFPSPVITSGEASIRVAQAFNVGESPAYTFITGMVKVPSNIPVAPSFMRVGLRTTLVTAATTTGALQWDYVTCRRST